MSECERSVEVEMASLKEAMLQSVMSSSALFEVAEVWQRMGLCDSQRETRRQALGVHITNVLVDIAQEETELENSMIKSAQINEAELASLCQQLMLPPEQISLALSLYEREKMVRQRVDALNKIKFERQKRLKRIKEMETTICTKLGEICEVCVSSQASHLPSEDELKQYLRRVEDLEITLSERQKKHHLMQHRVKEVTISLEMELGEEFVVFSDDGECVYSSDYMQLLESTFQRFNNYVGGLEKIASDLRLTIKSLWERLAIPQDYQQQFLEGSQSFRPKDIDMLKKELERLTELKKEHMETFILRTRAELVSIWTESLYGEQQQREFAPAFVEGPFNEDLLSVHENEVGRMRGFYRDNAEIFKLIKKREDMFHKYCELEHKDSDPSRLSNRGGQLLKDQAMKKQLMKELPRMERSLCDVLEDWEESHENFFMVFDARYLDTMKAQWEGKRLLKCHELIKKKREKETTTELEMTYGSKPSTPRKKLTKRVAPSPLPTTVPSKLQKMGPSPFLRPTTASGSRLPRSRNLTKGTIKTPLSCPRKRVYDRRKILGNKNTTPANGDTAASDKSVFNSHNFSLASAGSYTDFQHGIMSSKDEQKRSSVISKTSSVENVNL